MRVLFDTNVLASAFTSHGLCHQVYEHAVLAADLITSPRLLDELRRALVKKMRIEAALAEEILEELAHEFEVVDPAPLPKPICRDKDDDWVLATALAGRSEVIVTGDDDLLTLKEFDGIRILSPRQFAVWMERTSGS